MDKTNLTDGSMADKIAELALEQKQALFFSGPQPPYKFQIRDALVGLPWKEKTWASKEWTYGRGLEGLYCGILTIQRRNSDNDRSNENILKEHMSYMGDDRYMLKYLYDQIEVIPNGSEIKKDLKNILDEIKAADTPERRIELYNTRFLKYMRDLQPYLCPPTYSREEAIRLIKEAVDTITIRSTRAIIKSSMEMGQLEKSAQIFDEKIAPALGLKPGEPNPSRNIVVALSMENLMILYFTLRYGIKVRGLRPMEKSQDYFLTGYLTKGGYLQQGLVDFVYGHEDGYSIEMEGNFSYELHGDIIYLNTRFGDMTDEAGVNGVFHSLMPIGSLLLITPPLRGKYLPAEFEVRQLAMAPEEQGISLWSLWDEPNGPLVIRKLVQGLVWY